MGAPIPQCVLHDPLDPVLYAAGWKLVHRGKVRHTFFNLKYPGLLLALATNRVSVFDFPLPALVARKSEVLVALTVFWLDNFFQGVANHLVAFGEGADRYLPKKFRGNADLQSRALIVKHLNMLEMKMPGGETTGVEAIVRGYLSGNGLKEYRATGGICGHELPPGLKEWDRLSPPLFTPTTKEDVGHDENVDFQYVDARCSDGPHRLALKLYAEAAEHAVVRGLVLIDTKFEFGYQKDSVGPLTVADEVLTPDSSRYVDADEFSEKTAQGKTPASLDKQYVRNYIKALPTPFVASDGRPLHVGDKEFLTTHPEHVAFVHGLKLPQEILDQTTEIYTSLPLRLTRTTLENFQRDSMGIKVPA